MNRPTVFGAGVALLLSATVAHANPNFGADDVRTVFHIAKSNDRNRVDYGIHLDAECQPVGRAPVYAYWHRFEPGEALFGDLNVLDQRIYGIARQAVRTRTPNGSWVELRVEALRSMRILILIQRAESGCVARAQIEVNRRAAFVDRVFVQLRGSFEVEYVVFRGVDVQSAEPVVERRQP